MKNIDKGLTVPKWVLINWSKIPQVPQNLFTQIVCPSPKVWDFDEKKEIHWASVVRVIDDFIFTIFISIFFPIFNFRSAYTDQIMEILNKVAKQKSETKKVIEDIHGIQKDINMLEGKLSRTYADVDHRLFEQAKRDKSIIPTYR